MKTTAINNISQIGIPVKDIDRAVSFYQGLLQLPLLFNTDTMAFFDCDGVRLLLSLPEKEQFSTASSVLYFNVNDINASFKSLEKSGVSFIDKPHVVATIGSTATWMTFFNDTEGNIHALTSDVTG